MKAIHKILALVLAVMLLLACTACAKTPASSVGTESKPESTASTASSEEPSLFNVGTLPIVNEPVTLKILTMDPTARPFDTADKAGLWAWLTEKTGITLEIESYSTEEVQTKIPLIMATPDQMPDLFFRCNLTEADVMNYGQGGQLLCLDDLIEQYGTNVKKCFDTLDYAYGAAVSADGHIYSLPSYNASVSVCMYYMNSRWLENVGAETPKTLEELYEVFKLIKEKDANGNGDPSDEICLTGEPKTLKRNMLSIVGLSCYWPWQGVLVDAKDDQVFFVETSDQYKYMLQYLRKFYVEGMLDQEVLTQTSDDRKAKLQADRVFMSEANGFDPEGKTFNGITGAFVPTPLTSQVNDTPMWTSGAPYQTAIGLIAGNTKYPEVSFLLMDYLFSEEASRVAYWGLEGVDYKVVDESTWQIESLGMTENFGLSYYKTPMLVPRWNRDEWTQPATTQLGNDRLDSIKQYSKMGFQNYLHFTTEEAEQLSVYESELGLFLDDYYAGFITGTYDIDKDWDSYVAKCKTMGADKCVEIYQAAYNRYYGIG